MRTHVKATVILAVILLTLLFFWGQPAWAVTPQQLKMMQGQKKGEGTEEVQPPEQLPGDQIGAFMATLSDEQVRRLLIEELKKRAEEESLTAGFEEPTDAAGPIGSFIGKADAEASMIFKRINAYGLFRLDCSDRSRSFGGMAAVTVSPRHSRATAHRGAPGSTAKTKQCHLPIAPGQSRSWVLYTDFLRPFCHFL